MLRFITVGLVTLLGFMSGEALAGGSNWLPLKGAHRKVSVKRVKRRMRADGLKAPGNLLSHKYLLRLEVKGAGGGKALHSEIVVRLRAKPTLVLGKASTGDRAPNRAQIGGWKSCKIPPADGPVKSVGRTCPGRYNGRGFVDVTSYFTERNMLLVFDPPRRGTGSAVLWIASDVPQTPMWYYVIPGARGVRFGGGKVRAQRFQIDVAPAGEPTVPPAPDAGQQGQGSQPERSTIVRPFRETPRPAGPRPAARPGSGTSRSQPGIEGRVLDKPPTGGGQNPGLVAPPARKVRPHRPAGGNLDQPASRAADGGTFVRKVRRNRDLVGRRLAADGVPRYEVLLRAKRLVRIGVRDPGRGHDIAMRLEFPSAPVRIYGNSWGLGHLGGAQAGDEARCRQAGPSGSYSCPVRFNGLGWRNLTGMVTGRKMVVVHRGPAGSSSGVILWIALADRGGRVAYKMLRGLGGRIRIKDFVLVSQMEAPNGTGGIRPTRPLDPWSRGRQWRRLPARVRPTGPWQVQSIMRRDGLVSGGMLLRFPFVVRVNLVGAGGGTGVRTEVGLRFAAGIAAAVGRAWSDGREPGRAQVGPFARCRAGLYRFLPRGWRTCPLQFSNLGWRNLSQGLRRRRKILLISQPVRPRRGGMTLYLAFNKNPGPLLSRVFRRAGRYTLGRGRLVVQVFSLRTPRPAAPSQPPASPPPGAVGPEGGPGPEGQGYPGPEAPPPDDGPPGW